MKTITAEVYYGYYSGDSQLWDTSYVDIPGDTTEDKYEEVAKSEFMKIQSELAENTGQAVQIAFCGLYCIDEDPMVDDEDKLPQGIDAVCETCGEPCEYDSEICLCDKCQEK